MSIPLLSTRARYQIAGEWAYKGDLVITKDVIYFVPQVDLVKRRIGDMAFLVPMAIFVWPFILILRLIGLQRAIDRVFFDRSKLRDLNLIVEGNMEETVRRLDEYITNLKNDRSGSLLMDSMMLPQRFQRTEIAQLFSSRGHLTIDAQYDRHVYSIGSRQKDVHRTLLEEQFVKTME
jgi:hypothetical protein